MASIIKRTDKPTIVRGMGSNAVLTPRGTPGPVGPPGGSDAAFAGWVNDPASETRTALSATYARRMPHIEGVSWYAYGHSYLAADSRNSVGSRYITRLQQTHLPGSLANRAVGGNYMQSTSNLVVGNGASTWVVGGKGLVIVDATANDILWHGTSAVQRVGYEHTLRAVLATLSAGQRIEETDAGWTYTGTWTAVGTNANLSGGNANLSPGTASNEQVTRTFTGTECTLMTVGFDATTNHDVGELVIDGTVVASQDTGGVCNAGAINYINLPIRVTSLASGSHTLIWRRKNTRAGNIWLDSLLLPSAAPPTIVVVKQPYLTTAGYTAGGIGSPGNDATVDQYNAIISRVAAEFSNAMVADPTVGWDKTTMWGSDGYHPNDRGMAHYAAAIETALSATTWRHGLNNLTD